MRLLLTTQMVDREDPVLGFMHGWLWEFSKHFDHIHVICLKAGMYELPPNVTVYSLGKELGENRVRYVVRFISYAWKLRHKYDAVFSHMNPHYIVLMGWFWALMRKPMYLWRNHAQMNLKTRIAAFFARNVFYTSPHACTRIFSHSVQMPVGIDTNLFREQPEVARGSEQVLFLGRLSSVKRPELFIQAAALLPEYACVVYGDDPNPGGAYGKKITEHASENVVFHGAVPNYETPRIYSSFEIYVNLTPEGSMDKTVLEAAACGAIPVIANTSFQGMLPPQSILTDSSPATIAQTVRSLMHMTTDEKRAYRAALVEMVQERHSLERLGRKLREYIVV